MKELFSVFSTKDNIEPRTDMSKTHDEQIKMKLSSGEYNLVIDQARYPLAALSVIFASYDLHPDYQRNKVWDIQRKSKLIESLIMNIPIPPVFLYEVSPSKYEVMDGLQRISTIIDFFNNKFELKDLEIWPELNGRFYKDLLPEVQDAINSRYLSGSVILSDSKNNKMKQDELKRLVFERLNTGGMHLTRQEIRNAVNTGEMNSMINSVADTNELFNKLWNGASRQKENSIDRMANREMVLRFFTYKDLSYNNMYVSTLKALDRYSAQSVYFETEKVKTLNDYFLRILKVVDDLFSDQAFNRKINGKSEKMFYDAIMLACSTLVDENIKFTLKKSIEENVVLKNKFIEDNKELFNGKYTSFQKVKERQERFVEFLYSEII